MFSIDFFANNHSHNQTHNHANHTANHIQIADNQSRVSFHNIWKDITRPYIAADSTSAKNNII